MTETPKPWTADQKLRADATDEQIFARWKWHMNESSSPSASVATAREFASSCVAAGAEDSNLRDAVVSYFADPDAFTDWWNKKFDKMAVHPVDMLLRWQAAARQGDGL